jgi:dTDP-4-dehydrorhamnose reductase
VTHGALRTPDLLRVVRRSGFDPSRYLWRRAVDEDAAPTPTSIYAKTRLLSEELLLTDYLDIGPVVLRIATVFDLSRRMRFDLVVNAMTARANRRYTVPTAQYQP